MTTRRTSRQVSMARKKKPVVFTCVLQSTDDYGVRRRPHECVLYAELTDKYGPTGTNTVSRVRVNGREASLTVNASGDRLRWKLDDEVKAWIAAWDNGEDLGVQPVVLRVSEATVTPGREQAKKNKKIRKSVDEFLEREGLTHTDYIKQLKSQKRVRTR